MTSSADFTVEGTSQATLGYDATNGQVLTLQLENAPAVDVQSVTWSVAQKSKGAPDLVFSPASGQPATLDGTVDVTMPASGIHTYILRCQINGGVDARNQTVAAWTKYRAIAIRTGNGLRKMTRLERTEYEVDGWTGAFAEIVEQLALALLLRLSGDSKHLVVGTHSGTEAGISSRPFANHNLPDSSVFQMGINPGQEWQAGVHAVWTGYEEAFEKTDGGVRQAEAYWQMRHADYANFGQPGYLIDRRVIAAVMQQDTNGGGVVGKTVVAIATNQLSFQNEGGTIEYARIDDLGGGVCRFRVMTAGSYIAVPAGGYYGARDSVGAYRKVLDTDSAGGSPTNATRLYAHTGRDVQIQPNAGAQTSAFSSTHFALATPLEIPSYTTAELNAGLPGQAVGWLVNCSDGDAGAECMARFNGTNWLVSALGAAVATS